MPDVTALMRHHAQVTISVEKPQPVSCAGCGTVADELPVGWCVQTSARGPEHLCEQCTRHNVRNIESQLPTEWWS
jgi:recombinational DNA repair protein (RecF pathway)